MFAELLVIAALTAGWAWLQVASDVVAHHARKEHPTDLVR